MGLVHTPRVIAAIARGLYRPQPPTSTQILGLTQPGIYQGRAGLFDVDYLGHLNNASYLNHAELARWQLMATNGILSGMIRHDAHFLVASTAIRYRKEIRPLWRRFTVETVVRSIQEDSMWLTHNFRHEEGGRILAQVVVRGVCTKDRKVLAPRTLFVDLLGLDATLVDSVKNSTRSSDDDAVERSNDTGNDEYDEYDTLLSDYAALEESFRQVSAMDDDSKSR